MAGVGEVLKTYSWHLTIVALFPVAEGKLYTWGSSSEGQTGQGGEDCNVPTRLQLRGKVVAVSCGYYHMAVVTGEL